MVWYGQQRDYDQWIHRGNRSGSYRVDVLILPDTDLVVPLDGNSTAEQLRRRPGFL